MKNRFLGTIGVGVILMCLFVPPLQAQDISLSSSILAFDTSLTSQRDSLSFWITNRGKDTLTVRGITTYRGVFSVRDTHFVVQPNDSTSVWIYFSAIHNLTYDDVALIGNAGARGTLALKLTGTKKYSEPLYAATQGLSGDQLKAALKTIASTGQIILHYNGARDQMYGFIDNVNGEVECIYTGRKATFSTRSGATANGFNCEHTWPQSKFDSNEPMVCDLNHLFPTDETANNKRSNLPFGVVQGTPTWTVGGSKLGSGGQTTLFEPRDEHKGDCARAMFYFITRYPENYGSFWRDAGVDQEAVFRDWNRRFPPTIKSTSRNNSVQFYQGNRNPYIDHPEFVERISRFDGPATIMIAPKFVVSPSAIQFGTASVGDTLRWHLILLNAGSMGLKVTSLTSSNPAFRIIDTVSDIASSDYRTITIEFIPSQSNQTYTGTITATSSDTVAGTQAVQIVGKSSGVLGVRAIARSSSLAPLLEQNYPNPFNPTTHFQFTVPAVSISQRSGWNQPAAASAELQPVRVAMFDVLGREVTILVDQLLQPGEYSITVDAASLPAGAYFYRLNASGYQETKRMMLVK